MTQKPTFTYIKNVGCGKIYVMFVEHLNGSFDYMLIRGDVSRSTDCGESWYGGVSRLLTFSLRRAFKEEGNTIENGITKQLIGNRCNKYIPGKEHSCISAIGACIHEYIKRRRKILGADL